MCSDCSSAANLGEKWPHMWVLHESATPANVHLMSMYMSKLHDLDYAKIQNCFANNSFVKQYYTVFKLILSPTPSLVFLLQCEGAC